MDDVFRILVVEDEAIIAEMIKIMLQEMGHAVPFVCHNKEHAETVIAEEDFDFAVLDINLEGGMEGIELAHLLKAQSIPFMFLTSYADRSTLEEAKQTLPGAYVLKPFTEQDLYTGMEMSLMHLTKEEEPTVKVKDGHRSIILKVSEIKLIRADNIYVEIHAGDKKLLSRQSLSTFLELLPEDKFLRVHRSYAVNKDHISSASKNSIEVENMLIPISRSFRDQVIKSLDL